MKNVRLLGIAATLLLCGAAHALAQDLRFSATLNTSERSTAGLGKLTSDQVAVIDALVRRDLAHGSITAPTAPTPNATPTATFSQRLTPNERSTAGLGTLSALEVGQLDALVERYQAAKLARALLAPPAYLAPRSRVTPTEKKTERELHGTFSLSYGFGSGGYSEKTGAMTITMEDPAKGYSVSIGYAESHVKGGSYIYRDPYYDRPRILSPDEPPRP